MKNEIFNVIKPDQGIKFNAVIDHWSGAGDSYAEGYKRAAKILLERFLKDIDETATERDILILPILFLFRHYLELRFKDIIVYGSILLGRREKWLGHHDLKKLWGKCRPICEGLFGTSHAAQFDEVEECVLELDRLDPDPAVNFRYPRDRNDRPIFQHLLVGLKNLYEVIERLSGFLDSLSMDIAERLRQADRTS